MESFIPYLLRSAAWLSGFAFIYLAFLRKERFFRLKRYYLLAGIIASMVFPFINLHYQVIIPEPVAAGNMPGDYFENYPAATSSSAPFSLKNYLVMFYILMISILASRIILQMFRLISAIKRSKTSKHGNATIIRASEYGSSFSFFNYIFVNASVNSGELKEILNHELVHINQKHWLDLLMGEILRLLQWANPFAWIYVRFIRQNHEYLADEDALQHSSDPALYKAALLNQVFRAQVISISNSFNYSITKTRFDMMKKIVISPYRKLKVLMVLPMLAVIFYAFATPEYKFSETVTNSNTQDSVKLGTANPVIFLTSPESINHETYIIADNKIVVVPTAVQQNRVQGMVVDEAGKPLRNVNVSSTGGLGTAKSTSTDEKGQFSIIDIDQDARLSFMLRGYKPQSLQARFSGEMTVVLAKDPGYQAQHVDQVPVTSDQPLIILDGEITKEPLSVINSKFSGQLGPMVRLAPKEAIEKYGDAGKNGAIEIYTRKKAEELGLKNTFKRTRPEDFPTFQGGGTNKFSQWVADNTLYPAEAVSKDISGRLSISLKVEPDGTLSDIKALNPAYPILSDAVINAIKSAPQWEPAKTTDIKEPYIIFVNIRFELPDKVRVDKSYVVAEKMPQYPGGDKALLEFISQNTKYPEDLKYLKITGRVMVRFLVNYEGNVTEEMILKGVHPKLDAEALRVVKLLKGWEPGIQDGRPVDVWYMVPVNFTFEQDDNLPGRPEGYESPFSEASARKILQFIGENTKYPATAKNSNTEGKVYVTVKMGKGGIVRECKASAEKDGIIVPVIQSVVIVGYRSDKNINSNELRPNKEMKVASTTEILENEALRVAKLLGKVNAPEWQDKDMEFAIQLKFTLR